MRKWEPPRSKADGQTKLKMRRHHQDLASNWILVHLKVTVLLCHTQDRLLHDFDRILVIIRLWIIIWCTCNHMVYNILFHIQSMVHHNDRLLLIVIWSRLVHVLNSVRIIANKVLKIHSRGGVPRAYLTPKRGGCNECARKSLWNNKRRLCQQGRRPWSRYGGLSKLFRHQLEEKVRYGQ